MAETLSPISAAKKPPVSNPISPIGGEHASTLKLKPVVRKSPIVAPPTPGAAKPPLKPAIGGAPAAATKLPVPPPATPAPEEKKPEEPPKTIEQLKSVTQRLKGVTQQIPQQAILHKTGIISDQALTDAQKQASKARTARISLSDALGVAPVKESAPMKTIRIKRPADIGSSPTATVSAPVVAPPVDDVPADDEKTAATEAAPTLTQRKTLKVARPGAGGPKAPTKLGIKKPSAASAPADGGDKPAEGDVADIADIPEMPAVPAFGAPAAAAGEKDVPAVVGVLSLVVQLAACLVIGFLAYQLYTANALPSF